MMDKAYEGDDTWRFVHSGTLLADTRHNHPICQ